LTDFLEEDATPTAAGEERDKLSSTRAEILNSSFQPETASAATGGEGGMHKRKKILTRSFSLVEEAATATIQTHAEERSGSRRRRMGRTLNFLQDFLAITMPTVRDSTTLVSTKITKDSTLALVTLTIMWALTQDPPTQGSVDAPSFQRLIIMAVKKRNVQDLTEKVGGNGVTSPATAVVVTQNPRENILTTPGHIKLVKPQRVLESKLVGSVTVNTD